MYIRTDEQEREDTNIPFLRADNPPMHINIMQICTCIRVHENDVQVCVCTVLLVYTF